MKLQEFLVISDSDKGIKLPWVENKNDPLYKEYGYHTGVDIYADRVYSLYSGVVINIGRDNNYYVVTVQYDSEISLRYMHLKSVYVKIGQAILNGVDIGTADKYVHVECVTKTKGNSIWAVRIGTETYYKQNPIELIGD